MAWAPLEQALTMPIFGPRAPTSMLTWPEAMSAIIIGTRERTHPPHTPLVEHLDLLGQRNQAADAGADIDTRVIRPFLRDLQVGIAQRFLGRYQAELHKAIGASHVLGIEIVGRIESPNLAGNPAWVAGGVEGGDRYDAGSPLDDPLPTAGHVQAQWGNRPHPSDYYAAALGFRHVRLFPSNSRSWPAAHPG